LNGKISCFSATGLNSFFGFSKTGLSEINPDSFILSEISFFLKAGMENFSDWAMLPAGRPTELLKEAFFNIG